MNAALCAVAGALVITASSCQSSLPPRQPKMPAASLVSNAPAPKPARRSETAYSAQAVEPSWDGRHDRGETGMLTIHDTGGFSLAFYLYVSGPNGHSGQVEGEADLVTPTRATWSDERNCTLTFDLEGTTIKVGINDWSSCRFYHGARCYLDGSYQRVVRPGDGSVSHPRSQPTPL